MTNEVNILVRREAKHATQNIQRPVFVCATSNLMKNNVLFFGKVMLMCDQSPLCFCNIKLHEKQQFLKGNAAVKAKKPWT